MKVKLIAAACAAVLFAVAARGQVIAEGSVAEVQANPKVQEVYLGTAAAGADGIELVEENS